MASEFKVISSSGILAKVFTDQVGQALDEGFNIESTHVVVNQAGTIVHVVHLYKYN